MEKSQKPLTQHLTSFLDWLDIEKGLSNKSQENYSRFLKKFIDWLKKNNLEDLKPTNSPLLIFGIIECTCLVILKNL